MTPAFAAQPDDTSDDPHLWLEDVTGEKQIAWVRERNAESTRVLTSGTAFPALERRILSILDSKERIPTVTRIGDHYYNLWRDAANPKGVWRRTTLDEYRKAEPAWETVIDIDALAKAEKENWVWHGAAVLEPEDRVCLVSLSRGGADADIVREFDLDRKAFVDDGFSLPEAKSRVAWRGRESLFVATDFGPGSLTTSGYPRTVREWARGTPLPQAEVVFEGQPDDMAVGASRDLTPGFERDFLVRQITFWTNEFFLRRGGQLIKIDKPDDANASVHREWLLIELRSPWTVEETTYPAGALLAANFEAFLKGDRTLHVLFEPTDRTSLAAWAGTRNHILLTTLDNVRNRISVLTFTDGTWHREPLSGVPDIGTATVSPVDEIESDDYWLLTSSPLEPSTLSLGSAATPTKTPEKLKHTPAFFDASGMKVEQHEAVSKDGTRIPYFQIGRADLPADGSTPTLLYGYGGFEIPLLPGYSPASGVAWLEKGHAYVIANIRGGGEFGPRWHQAALKEKRHRAYEDFAAVAEDLISRKVTSPAHLGIMGGSNGGLLMGNMLTTRPDLFGAVVCQVPLLDMRRFNKLLAGASWMGEYGNPDTPEEWAFIRGFSPYHNVARDRDYPPILITTSTRDDRVHPGHARKMTARLLEYGKPVLSYENIEGGHGGASDNKQKAFMDALGWTFLDRELTDER